jgi:hypothetical protein
MSSLNKPSIAMLKTGLRVIESDLQEYSEKF